MKKKFNKKKKKFTPKNIIDVVVFLFDIIISHIYWSIRSIFLYENVIKCDLLVLGIDVNRKVLHFLCEL